MSYSKKPKKVDFSSFESRLRELGIEANVDHLNKDKVSTSQSLTVKNEPSASWEQPIVSEPQPTFSEQALVVTQEASDRCNEVFGTLFSIYESTWVQSYGKRPTGRFLDFADSLTDKELVRIIQHCRERLQSGDRWPPIMGELVVLKDLPTESELEDALNRVVARTPNDDIELWLMQSKFYELRRLPEHLILKKFREYYRQAMKLLEKGKLTTAPIALPTHSVKSMTDLKREEYEHEHGNKLHPRIQAILDAKKNND
ncbi:hypothetical protein ABVD55_003335 [Vibrio harveyi]